MDTKRARNARKVTLTKRQKQIITGLLLGDGYLVATTRGFALRINHSIAQKAYVDWKYQELKNLTNSAPCIYKNKNYYFRTVSHPFFTFLRKKWYTGRTKVLPEDKYLSIQSLALSVWFMDDGSKDGNQVRINTQSFSYEEQWQLLRILETKLGILATLNRDKDKFRLRVKQVSMSNFRKLVVPYIIPNMYYKLSP